MYGYPVPGSEYTWLIVASWDRGGADTSCLDSKNCHQAPVVQKMNNAIHWINLYPVDKLIDFPNTCPLDCVAKSLEKFSQ